MATSAAAAAILVLFDGAVLAAYMIAFAPEIIGMAGGTERRVLGEGECNILVIALVASVAAQVSAVIARIAAACRVFKTDRRPRQGGMTIAAFCDGNKVSIEALGFVTCRGRAVVARRATAGNALMVEGAAGESGSAMTVGAIQAGRYVIRRHPARRYAVARSAIVHDAGVIERSRDKSNGVVANTAILAGDNVTIVFACRETGGMA